MECDINFVAGEHGKICYPEGHEPKSIKYKVLFETLEDCDKFINRNNK